MIPSTQHSATISSCLHLCNWNSLKPVHIKVRWKDATFNTTSDILSWRSHKNSVTQMNESLSVGDSGGLYFVEHNIWNKCVNCLARPEDRKLCDAYVNFVQLYLPDRCACRIVILTRSIKSFFSFEFSQICFTLAKYFFQCPLPGKHIVKHPFIYSLSVLSVLN